MNGSPWSRSVASPLVAAAVLLVGPVGAAAQYEAPPPPAAYALENVTVVRADGSTQRGATLVVRGAFVEALGPGAAVPADALRLEGDSLWVYPGFVDGEGAVDFDMPEMDREARQRVASWAPPRDAQGFTPHRRVVDYLEATGGDVASLRKKGVVAAAVHPEGPLMPGRGVLVSTRADAATTTGLVLQPVLGPTFSLQGARGSYPGTLFGVIAFTRQAFEDARRDAVIAETYARGPRNIEPPRWDPDYEVLRDALAGRVPVFYRADGAGDIRRVLDLSREYGFRPIIVGGEEAWKVADLLRGANVPVLVSLDFDDPERTEGKEDVPESELDAAALAERRELTEAYENAGKLHAAGVRIALTSGGGDGDLVGGARKAIEHGLPEAAALAALTSVPAQIYGIQNLVGVDPGMPANLVVTNGPLFGERSRIVYAFVEGSLEKGARPGSRQGGAATGMGGEWDVTFGGGEQTMSGTMELTQEGDSFSGTLTLPFGELRITDGTISGSEVTFSIEMQGEGSTFTGTLEGGELTASGTTGFGQARLTATRTGPGGAR